MLEVVDSALEHARSHPPGFSGWCPWSRAPAMAELAAVAHKGEAIVDEVLTGFARTATELLRDTDVIGRWGAKISCCCPTPSPIRTA